MICRISLPQLLIQTHHPMITHKFYHFNEQAIEVDLFRIDDMIRICAHDLLQQLPEFVEVVHDDVSGVYEIIDNWFYT